VRAEDSEDDQVETISLRPAGYRDPDVQRLVAQVQQEYVQRYGGKDVSPIAADEFDPPNGLFFVAEVDGRPAAMGGWRRISAVPADSGHHTAEIRRMYVSPQYRGRGLSRILLEQLETSARDNSCRQLILETGLMQPEALELYRTSGYSDVPAFGHYADSPLSVHLGKRVQ
jgi:GNAT superfamily N-acetyltransferase